MNIQRLMSIIKKEFIQIKRDKMSLKIAIAMPIIFLLIFGYAVKTEVDNINIAVVDLSKTQESREYIQKFKSSLYFNPSYYVENQEQVTKLIENGNVKAGLIIPPDYTETVNSGKEAHTLLIIDGSDPTVARTAYSSGQLVSQVYSLNIKTKAVEKFGVSSSSNPGVELRTKVWYNPQMESTIFTMPGIVGLVMQNITIILTAFALVRERERGTIEQLIVTPVRPVELIIGKMIPYILIGYVDFLLTLAFATLWFKAPVNGSLTLLLILGGIFVIVALAIGMLISTISTNQLQAMQAALLAVLPSILLSGFIFPREAMPWIINALGYFIPLTYFLIILRGIMLKGIGLEYLWPQALVLILMGIALLALATLRFRKKLD